MAKAGRHIHQYVRTDIGKKGPYIVFKCALPNCSHYLAPELVVGKLSICPHCDTAFELKLNHLMLAKPHCDECKNQNHWKVREILEKESSRVKVSEALADLLIASSGKKVKAK